VAGVRDTEKPKKKKPVHGKLLIGDDDRRGSCPEEGILASSRERNEGAEQES